jgi:hypothetical protein
MYARERVRPKPYDLDSEKLSRLFADLRRELATTGSFPITVRHLESMIRMAEASAQMSLHEYVCADDIDLAISVAVESFINAQKMSIKKTLQCVHVCRGPIWGVFKPVPVPTGHPTMTVYYSSSCPLSMSNKEIQMI